MKKNWIYEKNDRIVAKSINERNNFKNKIRYDKLTYQSKKESITPISFNGCNHPLGLIKKIKYDFVDLEKEIENQGKLKSNLKKTIRAEWVRKIRRA